jgi:hypothetical protein
MNNEYELIRLLLKVRWVLKSIDRKFSDLDMDSLIGHSDLSDEFLDKFFLDKKRKQEEEKDDRIRLRNLTNKLQMELDFKKQEEDAIKALLKSIEDNK